MCWEILGREIASVEGSDQETKMEAINALWNGKVAVGNAARWWVQQNFPSCIPKN